MKKRILAVLLALALLGAMPAAAAEPAAAPLPAVGDVVHGFEVIETRDYPLMDAVIVCFEHQKTGAELFYIANDDTNRAFDLTFFTDAIDNTGLPHVFEHATTAGSEKYPSPALWFNLEFQTYNTYINAMTGKRFTAYPCASLSEAQLLKYADYFTDSCLHPTLMEDESVFRTEAWRYRMDSADAPLTIEGTVYSEMQGAYTLSRVAEINALRAMFPGSLVGNDSGGDPDNIPDLTWEALKDYHDRYYHPSNCAAYLYGAFEDYAAFLELLDGYFSQYERQEFTREDAGYVPITEPVVQVLPFPVEQGSSTEHSSTVYYGIVCPGLKQDSEQEILMNTLTDLLADSASNFQQSLRDALPYGSFWAHIERRGPEAALVFSASNVDPEDAEVFQKTVDAALLDVAENGFPQDQVDGVMSSLKISALLVREGSDPVGSVLQPLFDYFANSGDCWSYLDYQDGLFRMDEWNEQGLYARGVSDWLIGSDTTVLVTTFPAPGEKEQKDAALAALLAERKAGMSEEEISAIVAASNAVQPKDDASEYVAQLNAVTVDSLPEEWKLYEVSDETGSDGVRRIDSVAGVDGIGLVNMFLDAAGLSQEDIHWYALYTSLLCELDTAEHTKAELAKLTGRYLYGMILSPSVLREGEDGWHPYLQLRWIAMDDDLAQGYDLMREILFGTKLDDPAKLLEQVQSLRARFKSSVAANPVSLMMRSALAIGDELYRYSSYAFDLAFYDFLGGVEQLLETDPGTVSAKLQAIQAALNNRTNAVVVFAGSPGSIALNRELSDAFLASLDAREIVPAEYDLPVPEKAEALVIDSGVQYNLLMAPYEDLGLEEYSGDLAAVTSAVSDTFLFPLLRDQYGVYTPQHFALDPEGIYIYAYCDPNIAETFQMLDELPALVADMEMDQATLDGYIMSAYSGFAMPSGELSGAVAAASAVLQGEPQDKALTSMRQLKALTPEKLEDYADMYAKLAENGARRTAGSAAAINANAALFDVILNPFGAVDKTQQAFSDAPEGSAYYDGVRFAFENGFMLPLDGDVFGVDEPAAWGDLLAALHVLVGGEPDAEAALEIFAQYGLVDGGTDLGAPIAPEDMWGLFSALKQAELAPLLETADPAAVTRGELAEALLLFLNGTEE